VPTARSCAKHDTQEGRHRNGGAPIKIQQNKDHATHGPGAREDRRLAGERFPRRAALRGIWFHPRNEPPQCPSDVHHAANRNGDSPYDYQRPAVIKFLSVKYAYGPLTERPPSGTTLMKAAVTASRCANARQTAYLIDNRSVVVVGFTGTLAAVHSCAIRTFHLESR
jgi:hypothetical protein